LRLRSERAPAVTTIAVNNNSMRIIYLCTSNVCRSPLAEAIARDYLQRHEVSDVEVVSRGLTNRYSEWGSGAEPRMIEACKKKMMSDFNNNNNDNLWRGGGKTTATATATATGGKDGGGGGGGSNPSLPSVVDILERHKAEPLGDRDSLRHDDNVYFIVTSQHLRWARDYGLDDPSVFDQAVSEKRVRLVSLDGTDVQDPFFGEADHYEEVADILLNVVSGSLAKVLEEERERQRQRRQL
jgi:protein-tyrosine-phosphatase